MEKQETPKVKYSGALTLAVILLMVMKLEGTVWLSWWHVFAPILLVIALAIAEILYRAIRFQFDRYRIDEALNGYVMVADLVKRKKAVEGDVFQITREGWEYLGNSPAEVAKCSPQGCGRVVCDQNGCLEVKTGKSFEEYQNSLIDAVANNYGTTREELVKNYGTPEMKKRLIIDPAKPHGFCVTPGSACSLNYCDENGCADRKRNWVHPHPES